MLASDNSVKYQCICPGDVPKTSCTIQTNHSLFFFYLLAVFFFSFLYVYVHLNQKTSSPSMILYSCCNRRPSERLSPKRSRRHWVSVWCKTACFGWKHAPPHPATPVRDSSTKRLVGRRHFFHGLFVVFFFPLKTFPRRCVAWLVPTPL